MRSPWNLGSNLQTGPSRVRATGRRWSISLKRTLRSRRCGTASRAGVLLARKVGPREPCVAGGWKQRFDHAAGRGNASPRDGHRQEEGFSAPNNLIWFLTPLFFQQRTGSTKPIQSGSNGRDKCRSGKDSWLHLASPPGCGQDATCSHVNTPANGPYGRFFHVVRELRGWFYVNSDRVAQWWLARKS